MVAINFSLFFLYISSLLSCMRGNGARSACLLAGVSKELIKYYRVGVKAAYTVKSLLKLTYVLGLSNRFFTIHTVWSDSHAHCFVYMQIDINARFNSMHPLSGYSTLSNLFACKASWKRFYDL